MQEELFFNEPVMLKRKTLNVNAEVAKTLLNNLQIEVEELEARKARLTAVYLGLHNLFNENEYENIFKYDHEVAAKVLDDNILHIKMKGLFPFYHRHRQENYTYYRELRDHYVPRFISAINKTGIDLKFERAFVLLYQKFPNNMIRDLDNQFKNFIFNAIRGSGIISDDNFNNIAYLDAGKVEKTEPIGESHIFVSDIKAAHILIEKYLN